MSIEIDVRNLAKWLNEEQLAQIDKQALARVLAHLQTAEQQKPYCWKVFGVSCIFMGEFAEHEAKSEAKRIGGDSFAFPLYTSTPVSKPWVGLTHDEVDSWELPDCPTVFEFAQFIEAKLKEKNA